jgi:hypothetical protein
MNKLWQQGKYTIPGAIITTLAILTLWKLTSPFWCTIIFVLYLLFFGYYLGQYFIPNEKRIWQIFFGVIGLLCLIIIPASIIYYFWQTNREIFTILLIIIPLIISRQKTVPVDIFAGIETEINLESYTHLKSYLNTKLLVFLAVLTQLLLLITLIGKRYGDTLISPWTIIGQRFFLIFLFLNIVLFWILQKSKHIASNLLLLVLQATLTLSVTLIIFKYGYGFDPIIHQATEKWILNNGFILPKQPYYIGQYLLIILSALSTKLSLNATDIMLVPISASLILPFSLYFLFSRYERKLKLTPALLSIFFIPLTFFTVSTPNNLALLLSLVLFCWIWYEKQRYNLQTRIFGSLLAVGICTIHAFIGLPVLIIYLGSIILPKIKNNLQWLAYTLYSLLLGIILPLTFYLNSWRLQEKFNFVNPLKNLIGFINIFKMPHWIWLDKGATFWQTLYLYREAIRPLAVLIIIIGLIISLRKNYKKQTHFFIGSSVGLIFSAFLLATAVRFNGVISYEQMDYGMRILELTLVMLLPFFVITIQEFFLLIKKRNFIQFLIAILFAGLLVVSWYFTYPTRDPVSFYTGYNVREADIATVHAIDNRNNGVKDYIVLTNQTVASAALREFGFVKYLNTPEGQQYFYSIPTGGPFYQYFRKMVYEEPKRQWMEEAMRFAGVKKAYFVHTNYWAPAAQIRDAAKLQADAWWELAGGRVWVYEYILKD